MKKIFLIFITFFLAMPLMAQEQIKTKFLTDDNFKREMQLLFNRSSYGKGKHLNKDIVEKLKTDISGNNLKKVIPQNFSTDIKTYQKNNTETVTFGKTQPLKSRRGNAERPWQFMVFLAERDRNITETLNQLRYRIRQGTLSHASVLVTPLLYKKDSVKVEEIYFIYSDGEKPVTEHFRADNLTSTDELLSMLAKHLQENDKNLYTGMIVDAHGNGESMGYYHKGEEDSFTVVNLLKPFEEKHIKLDVLVLDACRMSSLFSLYYLTNTNMVDYLAASSGFMYGTSSAMYYHILRFLDYQPRDAAVRSVRYRPQFLNLNQSYDTTNAGVIELSKIRAPFQKWIREYYALVTKMPEVNEALKKWFPDEYTLRSLSRTVARQKKYVYENFDKIGVKNSMADCHNDDIKNAFIKASEDLVKSLDKATLTQWCYSSKTDRLFWDNIPDNDCMESVSVNQYQLDRITEDEEEELGYYKLQHYRCRIVG